MTVTLYIPTATYAQKAKKAIRCVGVESKLIKTVSDGSGGCGFALEIDESDIYTAVYELKALGIPYKTVTL